MAALVLGVVGGYFFGPLGFLGGELIGNLLFPQKQEGPRLKDLHLQSSEYGQPIPIAYGLIRIAGQVIWQTDLQEHKHTSGGKGGPEVTTYTYSASFAVGICEGVMAGGIRRIWADGTLIYDINGGTDGSGAPTDLPCTVHLGDEDQVADPTMEAELGVGNVPGFRGLAYVVFAEWDLSNYGNRIPNLNFEVCMKAGAETPITIIYKNNNEPHTDYGQERWAFRGPAGDGAIGSAFPVITHWALDGSDIRVRVMNSADLFTYSNSPTYTAQPGIGIIDPVADAFPDMSTVPGGGQHWDPCGYFKYQDGSTTPVWRYYGTGAGEAVSSSTYAVGATLVGWSSGHPTTSLNFAYAAGVTVGEFVRAVVLTQDGTACFVMTHPSNPSGISQKWYMIEDTGGGTLGVTASGTVTGNFPSCSCRANNNVNPQGLALFEDDRVHCWVFDPTDDGTGGGKAYIWKMTGSVLAQDVSAGRCLGLDPGYARTGIPNQAGPIWTASIYIPATGFMGAVWGTSVVLFGRLSGTAPTHLYEIVGDQSDRAGLDVSEYDVTDLTPEVRGYVFGKQADCRAAIQPLMQGFFFDATERAGVVTFVRRGKPSTLTIPTDDLAARTDGSEPPANIEIKRTQEVDLPALLNVTYFDPDFDYQQGSQQARRQVTQSQSRSDIELPIVFTASEARAVAWILLLSSWLERESFTVRLPRKYLDSEPTDVVTAGLYMMRFGRKTDGGNGIVQFEGVRTSEAVYVAAPTAVGGSGGGPSTPPISQGTQLFLLAIPLISDGDDGTAFYAAMAGAVDDTWRGASLYRSADNGATWAQVASLGIPSTIGTAGTALPDFGGGNVFDEASEATITIGPGGGELASSDRAGLMQGANKALLGKEIIQFRSAVLTAPGVYKLSGFLRGRRGTDRFIGEHVDGETFILLSTVTPVLDPVSYRGQALQYKAVTFGSNLSAAPTYTFTDTGSTLQPYSPVHLAGGINHSNDIIINWTRRTRIGGQWVNFSDVPLSEASEEYVLQVWDATYTVCARVVTGLTSPTFTYTAAMQTTDFGADQQVVYVTVAQIGSYGAGVQAAAAINGGGASIDAPLSPKTPYNTKPPPAPPVTNCSAITGTVTNVTLTYTAGVQQNFTPTDFGIDDAWVIKLVVPGSPSPMVINIVGAEYNGPPTQRDTIVGASPCATVPIIPGAQGIGDQGFSYSFYVGLNPDAKQIHLQPGQTIYITITTRGTSEMICNASFLPKPV